MPEIGATLREARMRARIDLSEVEAQTKIRARYLRALENEEWDLLPGPTFTRSFLRTYAAALGLDGKALVEEYRWQHEQPGDGEMAQPPSRSRRVRRERTSDAGGAGTTSIGIRGPSRGYIVAAALLSLVIVLLVIGLLSRGPSKPSANGNAPTRSQSASRTGSGRRHHAASGRNGSAHRHRTSTSSTTASNPEQAKVYLRATETVWVCLVGESEQKYIPGIELKPGEASGPYTAKRFTLTLGNDHVTMRVNGKPLEVPESTTAIGYEITPAGATTLPPAGQPTCG